MLLFNRYVFLMLLSVFVLSCGSDEEPSPEDVASCTDGIQNGDETGVDCGGSCAACGPSSTYYFTGKIDGGSILMEEKNGLTLLGGTGTESGVNTCVIDYAMTIGDLFNEDYVPLLIIEFKNAYVVNSFCDPDVVFDQFPTFFNAGLYDFSLDGESGTAKKIKVDFVDTNDKTWSSSNGVQPSGSKFEVTSSVATTPNYPGNLVQKVSGTVNCRLYDGAGNSIELTEGAFVYRYYYE